MATFDFIIGDDGRAKPVIPVTVFLTTEEEKAAMVEAAKRRTLRLIEWHPIEIRDGEIDGAPQECRLSGKSVLISYRTDEGEVLTMPGWVTEDEYGRPSFFLDGDEYGLEDVPGGIGQDAIDPDRVLAWAEMPQPYKPKEEEGTT